MCVRPDNCYADVPCTKEIAEPVRPPTFDTAWPAAVEALDKALPAELVTLERPSCALPAASEAPSLALLAPWATVLLAASVVDEAARLWTSSRDWRSASRGTA